MEHTMKTSLAESVRDFSLPRYEQLPNVGLYLEQTTKYITDCLAPLTQAAITGSMVSNYVKQKLVPNPVRKEYSRDHLVLLLFIAIVKNVLSLEDIRLLLQAKDLFIGNRLMDRAPFSSQFLLHGTRDRCRCINFQFRLVIFFSQLLNCLRQQSQRFPPASAQIACINQLHCRSFSRPSRRFSLKISALCQNFAWH